VEEHLSRMNEVLGLIPSNNNTKNV
jgi:hypothetical protein